MLSFINRRTMAFAALLVCLSAPITGARADVLFSNLDTEHPGEFDNFGWAVANFDTGSEIAYSRISQLFTPSLNATLTSADVPLGLFYGSTNSFTALVVGDDNGLPDDSNVLDSATVTDAVTGPEASLVSFSFNGSANLIAGNSYWLVLEPAGNDILAYWANNTIGQTGLALSESSKGGWRANDEDSSAAFQINGTPSGGSAVPEGSTLALILPAIGATGAVIIRRRKRTILA